MVVAGFLTVLPAVAALFDTPYELTPPVNGGYVTPPTGTTFGDPLDPPTQWTVTAGGDYWTVNTIPSPTQELQLSVIDHVGGGPGATDLLFETTAAANGTFGFNFGAAYGFNAPEIAFVQNGLDVLLNPASGSFQFNLLAGDTFGFRLEAISGAIAGQATLTIIPEAGGAAWAVVLCLLAMGRRMRVQRLADC